MGRFFTDSPDSQTSALPPSLSVPLFPFVDSAARDLRRLSEFLEQWKLVAVSTAAFVYRSVCPITSHCGLHATTDMRGFRARCQLTMNRSYLGVVRDSPRPRTTRCMCACASRKGVRACVRAIVSSFASTSDNDYPSHSWSVSTNESAAATMFSTARRASRRQNSHAPPAPTGPTQLPQP